MEKTNKPGITKKLKEYFDLIQEFFGMTQLSIDLKAANIDDKDEFFRRITIEFFRDANRRHPKFPLVRRSEYGVAVCRLAPDFENYWALIEPAARRNCKKATRLGYGFGRIAYNHHLDEITQILRSAATRQGRPMPERLLRDTARPERNPPSRSSMHDYPYFGVTRDGQLYAYAGCLVAGELCQIQTIYGHADYQPDGIIPMLITSIADCLIRDYPEVKYYSFGSYFGAHETMRRFKRKFGFQPYKVRWILGM